VGQDRAAGGQLSGSKKDTAPAVLNLEVLLP
jgi:hypothetical protein